MMGFYYSYIEYRGSRNLDILVFIVAAIDFQL